MGRLDLLTLIRHADGSADPDAVLLARFADTADESAFAELVRRYAQLVWGQCRNLLPCDADADDAFQATFLTLTRTARVVRHADRLGPWLHGVAYRVCLNVRRTAARRAKRERASAVREATRPVADATWEAAATAVHEEVSRLPDSLRVPFVLCHLEGKAPTAAAEQLGLPWGTFSSRLSRAKQRLLHRLAARGIGAAVAVGVLGGGPLAPAAVIERAVGYGLNPASAPASVLSLGAGVRGMTRTKLLVVLAMAVMGVAVLLPGGGTAPVSVVRAAPVPKDEEGKKKALDAAWADLASSDDLVASRALLVLRDNAPASFFAGKLKPLTLTEERAKELLADLASDDEKTWRAAYEEMSYLDPRLALGITDITLKLSKGQHYDERLAALLRGHPPTEAEIFRWCMISYTYYKLPAKDGMKAASLNLANHPDKPAEFTTTLNKSGQPRALYAVAEDPKSLSGGFGPHPAWRRAVRAVALLEQLGTEEAKKVLKGMTDGHPDAGPTIAAKASLEREKK